MTDDPPYNPAMSFEEDYTEGLAPKVTGSNPGTIDTGTPPHPSLFTAEFWANRDLPNPDFLLGDLMTTTSRMLLIGPTGIGKSNVGLAIAFAAAAGAAFLHWAGRRASKVIYIDGEMSARLTKDRVQQAIKRHGGMPKNLIIINREDFPDLPPLNTEAGQKFIEHLVEQLGSVDLIVFDNIQALLEGSHKEDLTWGPVLPWIRTLTAMRIGQIWMHHTGHSTDRGYWDKTREWQFDTVALMKAPDTPTPGRLLEFRLEFTKARERGPSNRADFETVDIWLDEGDVWRSTASPAKAGKGGKRGPAAESQKALDYLSDVMAKHGEFVTANGIPRGTQVVHLNHWRDRLKQRGLHDDTSAGRQWFYRTKKALIAEGKIVIDGLYVWAIKP